MCMHAHKRTHTNVICIYILIYTLVCIHVCIYIYICICHVEARLSFIRVVAQEPKCLKRIDGGILHNIHTRPHYH